MTLIVFRDAFVILTSAPRLTGSLWQDPNKTARALDR